MSGFTPLDAARVFELAETLSDQDILQRLEELVERERNLMDSPIGDDPSMREITIYNLAVLANLVVIMREKVAEAALPTQVAPVEVTLSQSDEAKYETSSDELPPETE